MGELNRDQIVTRLHGLMWVSLHSKTHPLFCNGICAYDYVYQYPCKLVSYTFSAIPICLKEYILATWIVALKLAVVQLRYAQKS